MGKVIAEIGLNHRGDLQSAKKLIRQASRAGCWGVKFQYRNLRTFYQDKKEVGDELIFAEVQRNQFNVKQYCELAAYCKELRIKFGISFFRIQDLFELREAEQFVDFYKIPSAECLNIPLIEELIGKNRKLFVSIGGHFTKDVIRYLSKYKNLVTVLHCIANYPVRLGEQDLNVISYLKKEGFADVGYSSHDSDWEVCLIAAANGAVWLERHITLDKKGNGLDDTSSSDFLELKRLVKLFSSYDEICGASIHLPNQGELINLQNLGTSLYAKRTLYSGQISSLDDFNIRAPRVGVSVGEYGEKFSNKKLKENLPEGMPLTAINFLDPASRISCEVKNFAKDNRLGIPVRLHDYKVLKEKFDLNTYEFHLSFSEVLSGDVSPVIKDISSKEKISIHLPDYIPGNALVDPLSPDYDVRSNSIKIIDIVCEWAERIEQKIGEKINIVGSFSCVHEKLRKTNLERIFEFISNKSPNILPQWLPVYAWYFGGSVRLDLFNTKEDIDYISKNNFRICLDLSHLVMSASYFSTNWKEWYYQIINSAEHLHISDANDSSSEGLMIGEGHIGDFSEILGIQKNKIIEPWQGHMEGGFGFAKALVLLHEQYKIRSLSNETK